MSPVVVVPLGAWEQHGPHLPSDTDTLIISAVAATAVARFPGVVLAPTLPITASDEHHGFGATLSIGTGAFASSVVAIARSAQWAAGVLFVNGHGGNADGLAMAREALRRAVATIPDAAVCWVASDGQEAVSRNRIDRADLVLMDLIMPVMDAPMSRAKASWRCS